MPDVWEERFGLDASSNDSDADPDRDGISNVTEYLLRMSPQDTDSDDDGLTTR